ncbi:iron ABC transporter ATP-binding protein [Marinilactibacillus psychrotolerans]|uniref:Iron ABC transporter ATP-binding protein n=1 Tax=Marinilactibacillus psychrotolerans TaxID=191770 RepID=A0AAV3WSL0_9LACT|nr:ATP-binding cassette domain-containing protein [Marinilactibacillus psychrotolerans]GEL66093.1 iron ABC transporter ATP-binding protein [Marinilactibacillus psychrotolerans]GEQ34602.1 iron ABC transporter ATP-binding protein [Marinilactibacillus psychrotolerans]SDB98202.1 iron complex transport system ATP-binding protein [Marinilactibacillus psychrotolerans]
MMEIKQLSKKYGQKKVVQDITVPIRKGEMTACIGPNGAGKSTLLEMVSKLIPSDTGEIYIDGGEIRTWKQNELAKRLSVLKQSNIMSMRLTIKELVSFGRFPYTKGRLNQHCYNVIEKSLNYMGLNELSNQYINTLSGGQLQRAMIAMVLAQDTDYILLDEPLNNLDMKYSVQMMKTMRGMVDDLGKTVITVIHDINFAAAYADNIIAMKEGKLFGSGTVDEMVTKEIIEELFEINIDIIEKESKKFVLYY